MMGQTPSLEIKMSVKESIIHTLESEFAPQYLEVVNESHGHNVPANSETHFKVVLATEMFEGKSQVHRHRAVYSALGYALENGVHALALHTYTPEEWAKRSSTPLSPECLGGGGSRK